MTDVLCIYCDEPKTYGESVCKKCGKSCLLDAIKYNGKIYITNDLWSSEKPLVYKQNTGNYC